MLDNGSPLPDIAAKDLEGNDITVAELTTGSWAAVLLYRGHW